MSEQQDSTTLRAPMFLPGTFVLAHTRQRAALAKFAQEFKHEADMLEFMYEYLNANKDRMEDLVREREEETK